MQYEWHDFLGNVGVALIIVSYLALQMERLDSRGVAFSLANAFGAGLVLISLLYDFNLSAFVIEIFWLVISVYGLMRRKYQPVQSGS